MGWLTLFIKHECPFCKSISDSLRYYSLKGTRDFIDIGDYIPNSLDSDIGFVIADGYCNHCRRDYIVKVGVRKSRLSNIVIYEGDVNGE